MTERLPPHSMEAEAGVLGCVLLDANCLPEVRQKLADSGAFYDRRHRTIYETLLAVDAEGLAADDMLVIQQRLKDAGELDSVGGATYVSSLPDLVSSSANVSAYLDIVAEKHTLRRVSQYCANTLSDLDNGSVEDVLAGIRLRFGNLAAPANGTPPITWARLLDYQTDHDDNTLLGVRPDGVTTRYLCRGHGAWLIGQSGIGKSSLLFYLATCFAAGLPAWGITPARPLRVLMVQAENDVGDLAEMARGIKQGMAELEFLADDVAANLTIKTLTGRIGEQFCAWLRAEIRACRAELVLIDPLLSFAGIDVTRQDSTTRFLRLWLDPVLRDTGAAMLATHHTGKPRLEANRAPQTLLEKAYAGLGSSDLVNWARAVMLLEQHGDFYTLTLAKRGRRAGACHPDKSPTSVLWLRHAHRGVFWEQVEPPQEEEPAERKGKVGRPSKVAEVLEKGVGAVLDTLEQQPLNKTDLAKAIKRHVMSKGLDPSDTTCKRAVEELLKNAAVKVDPNDELYRKA